MTGIQAVSPNFQGNLVTTIGNNLKDTYTDPTDCYNKEAVVGGTLATGGVSGAAVVASKFKNMRNMIASTQNFTSKAVSMKAKNISILSNFTQNLSNWFKNSKMTKWMSVAMDSPVGKKVVGGTVAAAALAITAAQLFSAADMAREAVEYYN